jgi:hypothetical protein
MKLKFIYTTFLSLLGATLWMSNSLGYAASAGQNGTLNGCSGGGGCHSGGTFKGQTTLTVKLNGTAVTTYSPGVKYQVELVIEKTSGGTALYGFQLNASKGTKDAGVFENAMPDATTQITKLGNGRTFVEHDLQMQTGTVNVDWTAPAKGTGTVTFFAVGNIVDGKNGNKGDTPLTPIKVDLAEGTVSANELPTWATEVSLTPNPVNDFAFLAINANENKTISLQIFNIEGKVMSNQDITVSAGNNNIPLEINGLERGVYLLSLKNNNDLVTRKFVKL